MRKNHLFQISVYTGIHKYYAVIPSERVHSEQVGKITFIINLYSKVFNDIFHISGTALSNKVIRLFEYMSPPTKELMKLTLEERIAHGGHKVLRWMMDNVFVRQNPAGNIKMDKEKSTEKIDGAVATVMALDRAIRNEGSDGSVYDNRGILVFW